MHPQQRAVGGAAEWYLFVGVATGLTDAVVLPKCRVPIPTSRGLHGTLKGSLPYFSHIVVWTS